MSGKQPLKEQIMDYRIEPELVHGQMTMFRVYAPDGTKKGCWFTEERAQQEITELKNPTPKVLPTTGWSNAAKARRRHPLGRSMEEGAGYTMYEDTAFGGGRVQIWDES